MSLHRETAAKIQAEHLAAFRHELQRRRDRVIAEFGADPQAMADEILRYRHAVAQMDDAIGWMRQGAPFIAMGPGPLWRPKPAGHREKTEAA